MTEKQENILHTALLLFAEEGYKSTSTARVAKEASVSEGLIFRHFGNKEGLLNAIMETGERKAKLLFEEIVMEQDPKAVLRKTIKLPFGVQKGEQSFWKLQYKLKWETNYNSASYMEPLLRSLTMAFEDLGYVQAETEAQLVLILIDGLASAILKNELTETESLRQLLLSKYELL